MNLNINLCLYITFYTCKITMTYIPHKSILFAIGSMYIAVVVTESILNNIFRS